MMRQIILILGMHRSGTSALTRVISLLGAALPKSILGKNESNLRGHWESEAMIAAHDALLAECDSDWQDWRRLSIETKSARKQKTISDMFTEVLASEYPNEGVLVVKEPRICRFAQSYIDALEGDDCEVHSIIMVRNPLEVAASLQARDGLNKLDALNLWLTHMLEAELATRGRSRRFVSYDSFLDSPIDVTEALAGDLPFALPYSVGDVRKQIEAYVSPSLKRQSLTMEDLLFDSLARGWTSEAFEAMLVLCENPESESALEKLDNIREGYFPILQPLHNNLAHERSRFEKAYQDKLMEDEQRRVDAFAAYEAKQKLDWAQRDQEHAKSWKDREDDYAKSVAQLEAEHVQSLTLSEDQHAQSLAQLESKHAQSIGQLEAEHAQALTNLDTEHAKALQVREEIYTKAWKERDVMHAAEISELRRNIERLQEEHASALENMDKEMSFLRDEFGTILAAAEARADRSGLELSALEAKMSAVLNSTSWKMTGGFRRVINVLKGVKTDNASPNLTQSPPPPRLEFKPKN